MQTPHLDIQQTGGTLLFHWDDGSGVTLERERTVHPDDLRDAEAALDAAPGSRADLERLGTRIFSRLLEREVRDAVFAAPPGLLTLTSNVPRVPWGLAFGAGRFLCEIHGIGRDGGTSPKERRGALRMLLVVNPTGDLPYSESEASAIAERLKHSGRIATTTLYGAAATRHAILDALETAPFDVIHFSCHAEHDAADPVRSHIKTFDGPLTAHDLSQAALATAPAMVVLNACESNRCGGTGPMAGLAGAFHAAGASAVIGTAWPVNNKAAGFLMSDFYATVAAGEPLGLALRSARLETRRVFAFDPLQTWAAFVLNGDPGIQLCLPGERPAIGRAPLVGRDREWELLARAWEETRAGRGRFVAILGPASAGKSRLTDEWTASLPGSNVIHLTNAPARSRDAWPAVLEAGDTSPVAAAKLTAWAQANGGGIVVCDDASEADDYVCGIVAAIAPAQRDSGLMVVIAGRDFGCLPDHSRETAEVITLQPLSSADARRLFEALGSDIHPAREMWPGEAERIALAIPEADTPEVMVDALPPLERDVVRAASVLGDAFDSADLARLTDVDATRLWSPLETLCRLDWLSETEPGRFRFRSPGCAKAVQTSIRPMGRLVDLHQRAGKLFESRGAIPAAAEHWLAAGETDRAHVAFVTAVGAATNDTDAADVLRWHELCLASGPSPRESGYWTRVARVRAATGEWHGARDAFQTALDLQKSEAEQAQTILNIAEADVRLGNLDNGDSLLDTIAAADAVESPRALILRSEIMRSRCRPQEALAFARSALSLASQQSDREVAASAALAGSLAALMAADAAQALELSLAGLAASGTAVPTVATALKRSHARALQYSGDYNAAEEVLAALVAEQRDTWRLEEQAATLLAMAELWRDQGLLDRALTTLTQAEEIGDRCRLPALSAEAHNLRASILRRQGRYPAALESAENARKAAEEAGSVPLGILATLHAATVQLEQGRLRVARSGAAKAARAAEEASHGFGHAWALNVIGAALLEMGDLDGAEATLRESLSLAEAINGHIGTASALLFLGWTALDKGEPDASLFEAAIERAKSISYRAVQWPAAFGLAFCRGDEDGLSSALREVEALNMGALAAWLRARRGQRHLQRGDAGLALADLASAYRVARRLGMAAVQSRSAAGLATCYEAKGEGERALEMRSEAEALYAGCLSG